MRAFYANFLLFQVHEKNTFKIILCISKLVEISVPRACTSLVPITLSACICILVLYSLNSTAGLFPFAL